jgi:GT2 family glycosyltransferase
MQPAQPLPPRQPEIPTWTLVTVTYNSAEQLRRHWQSRVPASVRWIVVDNASTDDSREVAAALGAEVIALPSNVGFGAANNVGYAQSDTEFVGFVNPDVSGDWDSLPTLADATRQSGGLLTPQLINHDGSLQPNGRGWPFLLSKVLHRTTDGSRDRSYRRYAKRDEMRSVVWIMGAVVLASRDVFERLDGPWDEWFFVYYEDADICLRARRLGIPTIVAGGVHWRHGWERATSTFNHHAWRREIPSMMKFYARYPLLLSPFMALTQRWLEKGGPR